MPEILVVEDNPLNLELATVLLETEGYTVLAARDADECLAVLAEHRPDLILMDIGLPGKDGLQLTRELRANPETRDLLIVAMTAHAMIEHEARVREAGCDGYLTKPIQTRSLAAQVKAFIAARLEDEQGGAESPPRHAPNSARGR